MGLKLKKRKKTVPNTNYKQAGAKSAYEYLIEQGVNPERITYQGHGETQANQENIDSEDRKITINPIYETE